jgi:NADPH:quinone reductase-like Zn-dependent oxidoreductase
MKAARITQWNTTPKYTEVPAPPTPGPDEVQIKVIAAGIHSLVRGRVTGNHFSATKLPHIPGSDGVGTTADGKLVYFSTFWEKGSMAELVNVAKKDVTPINSSNIDPLRVAGLVNPTMASWMAIKERVFSPPKDFSCLIVGATSTSGAVALAVAKQLGAGTVMGAARKVDALEKLGFEVKIQLKDKAEETDFSPAENVDVILDFLYGPATVHLFKSLKPKRPVQYVQIGTVVSPIIELPGDLLRSKDITIRGAAPGAYSSEATARELPDLVVATSNVKNQQFKFVKLEDIETAWADTKNRTVIQVSQYP